jgi:hypothetical protein
MFCCVERFAPAASLVTPVRSHCDRRYPLIAWLLSSCRLREASSRRPRPFGLDDIGDQFVAAARSAKDARERPNTAISTRSPGIACW